MTRATFLSALALSVACGPEAPGDVTDGASAGGSGTASSEGGGTDGVPETTSTPTSGGPTSSAGATTTGVPGPVDTTAATETTEAASTNDTGGESSTGLPSGECAEPFRQWDWNEPHVDCLVDWPTTTMIHGEGSAAGLPPVTRVFFGVGYYACEDGLFLLPIVLADPFQPAATLYGGARCGPELWLGESEREGELAPSETPISATLKIDGFAGDWMSAEPVDPPRLFGSLAGDLVGSFEAVHCAALDEVIDNCG